MNFFVFGDSICFGQLISPHHTWVSHMAAELEAMFPEESVTVVNASINGNTTRLALERMPYDLQSHEVDFLLIQFGMNDCNYWTSDHGVPRVSPQAFEANLLEIIKRANVFKVKHVFLATNHPSAKNVPFKHLPSQTYQNSNMEYNGYIRRVSQSRAPLVTLIDHESAWFKDQQNGININEYLLEDGIHLSKLGHNKYYETAVPLIREKVRMVQ